MSSLSDQQAHNEEEEKNMIYDPNLIIQEANEKRQQHNGDLDSGSLVFQTALLSWVDDARERNNTTEDMDSLKEAIATLWIAYAQYLQNANQFKSAFEAYEQAVSCPVAKSVGRVWLDYARFAEERGKQRKAENVYLRALVGVGSGVSGGSGVGVGPVTDEQDQEVLWQEFLEMKRRSLNNPDLTMEELQSAINENEIFNKNKASDVALAVAAGDMAATSTYSSNTAATSDNVDSLLVAPPAAKRAKMSFDNEVNAAKSSDDDEPPQRTYVVTMESVQAEATLFLKSLLQQQKESSSSESSLFILPPDVMASWMIRDGTAAAQPPEPPLFQAAPPRLQDPTGKDILGIDLALALNRRLVLPTPQSGRIVLEVCHGLWTMTLFQEKLVHDVMQELNDRIVQVNDAREAELQNRMSVAGSAVHAVEIMNANERRVFQQTLNQERISVMQAMAWDFRRLLCIQQQILCKLNVPGFESGPTVEASTLIVQAKICSYLHSAFYLRNRIGEAPHVAMLTKKVKQLEQEQKEQQLRATMTHSPIPPTFQSNNNTMQQQPQQLAYGGMLPMQQQQQQQQPPPPTYVYHHHGGPMHQQPPQQQQQQQHVPPTYAYQGGHMMVQQQYQQQPQMMYVHHQQHSVLPPPPPPPPPPPQQYPYYQHNR